MFELKGDVEVIRNLSRYQAFFKLETTEVIRKHARLLAIYLAARTQPFSVGESGGDAQAKGEGAIRRDVRKVVKSLDYWANNLHLRDKRLQKRLEDLLREGDLMTFKKLVGKSWDGLAIAARVNPKIVDSARVRGRVPDRAKIKLLVIAASAIETEVRRRAKRVGFAKGGWATAAKQLGGSRGIPGWVTRQKAPGRVVDRTSDRKNPSISVVNEVRYIGEVISPAEVNRAYLELHGSMMKQLDIAISKQRKL
jgi:hypothetical protein